MRDPARAVYGPAGAHQAEPGQPGARTLSELETLLRSQLKTLRCRHSVLGGFLTQTGLTLDRPD